VKELFDAGVDVNTKFRYDRMALSFAADRGHVESSNCSSSAAPTSTPRTRSTTPRR
jgi:hypothetical protein